MKHNKASAWLYIMRSAKNLSQRKLAIKVGITNTAISKAESEGYASAETWAKLAVYFKISTDAILWLAGVVEMVAPPKRELISRIEQAMSEMDPETRETAEQFIKSIINE